MEEFYENLQSATLYVPSPTDDFRVGRERQRPITKYVNANLV